MHVKLFEVRDNATCIAAIGIRPGIGDLIDVTDAGDDALTGRRFLLGKAGLTGDHPAVLFGHLQGGMLHADPYDWPPKPRTMRVAHFMVDRDWATLEDGAVIDVRVELGERAAPVKSDRLFDWATGE